jgi:hypothetical protein
VVDVKKGKKVPYSKSRPNFSDGFSDSGFRSELFNEQVGE